MRQYQYDGGAFGREYRERRIFSDGHGSATFVPPIVFVVLEWGYPCCSDVSIAIQIVGRVEAG
jgi:hypothetical protein